MNRFFFHQEKDKRWGWSILLLAWFFQRVDTGSWHALTVSYNDVDNILDINLSSPDSAWGNNKPILGLNLTRVFGPQGISVSTQAWKEFIFLHTDTFPRTSLSDVNAFYKEGWPFTSLFRDRLLSTSISVLHMCLHYFSQVCLLPNCLIYAVIPPGGVWSDQ